MPSLRKQLLEFCVSYMHEFKTSAKLATYIDGSNVLSVCYVDKFHMIQRNSHCGRAYFDVLRACEVLFITLELTKERHYYLQELEYTTIPTS